MLFFSHCNPRWVYGVFRDFFLGGSIRVFFFSFRPIVIMPYCSSIALHIAYSSYPKALDHSQLRLQSRHNIVSTPNCSDCHMVCVTTSELLVFFSLRVFLKTVLYTCSFTLLCSGRRYGFTFSGHVFHVTPVWINWLLRAVFNLKFTFSRLPLPWSHLYETWCN